MLVPAALLSAGDDYEASVGLSIRPVPNLLCLLESRVILEGHRNTRLVACYGRSEVYEFLHVDNVLIIFGSIDREVSENGAVF